MRRLLAVLPLGFAALVACEAVPELRFRDDGGLGDDATGNDIAIIIDPPAATGGDGAVLDDASADGATPADAGPPMSTYDKVCSDPRPVVQSFCCGDQVLCAGKARKCAEACPACRVTCAGKLCCLLKANGSIDRCSDSAAECAAAIGN